jgi:hypothetical protein
MNDELRLEAARAYAHAFHTGEVSASRRLEQHLLPDVIAQAGAKEVRGRAQVLDHVTGQQPGYTATQLGAFGHPYLDGDLVVVDAEFPPMGSGPKRARLTYSFGENDQIQKIVEQVEGGQAQPIQDTIPLFARGLIDNALVNGTPVVLGYVNSSGEPELSLRGSAHIYGPTELAIWLRTSEGGLAKSIGDHPRVTLLYRDNRNRTSLVIKGAASVCDDEAVRRRVYEHAPEVEQLHDPNRKGAALIVKIDRLVGSTPSGIVNFVV